MTTRIGTDDQPVCLLIDRAHNMYEIEVWANADYFKERTILDGELLWCLPNECKLSFLVFDAIRVKGKMYTRQNYTNRLQIIQRIIYTGEQDESEEVLDEIITDNEYILAKNNLNNLIIEPKRFLPSSMTMKIWKDRDNQMYRNDGIIFVKNSSEYCIGTAIQNTYKWKPYCTIDVVIDAKNVIYGNSNASGKYTKISKVNGYSLVLFQTCTC